MPKKQHHKKDGGENFNFKPQIIPHYSKIQGAVDMATRHRHIHADFHRTE
jgi:hypothetical protein